MIRVISFEAGGNGSPVASHDAFISFGTLHIGSPKFANFYLT